MFKSKQSSADADALEAARFLQELETRPVTPAAAMTETYVGRPPLNVRLALGHLANTKPAVPWDFPADMAGVGGVRATLSDMVHYLEGELGARDSAITPALAQTQQRVASASGHTMGMNWEILSTANVANGRTIVMHGGGTGGYSSFVAFDRAAKRATVLLSDTALTDLGGLTALGLHLLDPSVPVGAPRTLATADVKLIDALVGRYRLSSGLEMALQHKGSALIIQAMASLNSKWGHDSAGDFYPLQFHALLRPKRKADGTYSFTWFQLGGVSEALAIRARTPPAKTWMPTEAQLKEYSGNYPLLPGFALRVFDTNAKLFIQGTNQRALEVVFVDPDVFVAESVGAEFDFTRDPSGQVIALTLKQNGKVLRGERQR